MFLLVNAMLPQNYYTFLQLFSTFIFKRVPDYQAKEDVYNFTLLEITSQKLKILQNKPIEQLIKQPHSDKVMKELKPEQLPESLNKNIKIKKQVFKAERFLIYRMLQENEINLLMVVFCVSIQFKYDSRLTKKRNDYLFLRKKYHAIGMLKKVLLVVSIYFLVNFPMIISILGITLNSLSLINSLRVMPFKKMYHNIIKILGYSILIVVWCLMVYFIRFEQDHKKEIEFDKSDVEKFMFIGNVSSILVFILNILYLTQFIYDNIIYQLWSYLKERQFCVSKKNISQGFTQKQKPQKQQKEAQNTASLPQIQLINDKKYEIQIKKVSIVQLNKQVSCSKKKQQTCNLDQLVLL
ncbi:hypothetical protein ABPG72_019229 [Tetrahymena utriculariae]